jgi:hypothetical protein
MADFRLFYLYIKLKHALKVENGLPKFISDKLEERQAVDSKTGRKIYGYILKDDNILDSKQLAVRAYKVERGYFFTGSCFEYGTLYTGDNGSSLFVPCGTNCTGLDPVCPEAGEWG